MRAKLFNVRDTWHTLASVDESVHKCLRRFGYFSEAAIEDDGGTKTATDGALSGKIFCSMLTCARIPSQRQRETLLLRESRFQKSPAI